MQRFKNILVCHSQQIGNEAALSRATTLAKVNKARLTVFDVVEKLPEYAGAPFGSSISEERDLERRFIDERQSLLDRVITSIRQDGLEVEASVRFGPPFLEIIRAVLRDNHDLVIITADSWRGLSRITFGSTSMHVLRKCPCPVWVLKPRAGKRFKRILATVDSDVQGDAPTPLDVKILEMASSLARMEGCHLDILSAWDFAGADYDISRSEITDQIRERLFHNNLLTRSAALERMLRGINLRDVTYERHLPKGHPSLVIPQFVQDNKVDLVIMGTVTHSGIAGLFIGTTAEDVLRQVDCSVLTVKPEGFETPVKLDD
ncbi:MAG: universal stress protein [Alphaproteobacteria bacterium]